MRERQLNKKLLYIIFTLLILLLVSATGGLLARYVASNKEHAEMVSSHFHFTGEYLEESAQEYTITLWGDNGIELPLYNYEKTNPAMVSDVDIKYEVSVIGDWICSEVLNGSVVMNVAGNEYEMEATGSAVTHMLYFQPKTAEDASEPFTVTIEAKKPYSKKLSVTINPNRKQFPEWTFTDKGNYAELVIESNDWSGQITVKWDDAEFSPDNQNPEVEAMALWVNSDAGVSSGSFLATEYSTYKLIFFENTNISHDDESGTCAVIAIGGDQ